MGLDGVEMVLTVEEEFGIAISDGDAESLYTTRDLIEAVCSKLDMGGGELDVDLESDELRVTSCLSQRAFYKVRSEVMRATGVARGRVKLESRVEELFPKFKGVGEWKKFVHELGMRGLPWYGSWFRGHSAPKTVRDVVDRLVVRNPAWLRVYGRWSRGLVRERVRAIVSEQLGVREFDDDDEFVRDLGMD